MWVLERIEWPAFRRWLDALPRPVFVAVAEDLDYLLRYGRAATGPFVRQRIQESAHFPDMCETRTRLTYGDRQQTIRCLAVLADHDRAVVLCLGGDKDDWARRHPHGPDWYEAHVPVADEIYRRVKKQKGWP